MGDEDFNGIVAGLGDAIAYAKGDQTRGRVASGDVEAVNEATKLSQAKFATTCQFRPGPVSD